MLKARTLVECSGPAVAGALVLVLVWALIEVGPVAIQRWFGQ